MSNPLDKVIDLIKKTGDNCIIVDQAGNPTYVVMDFGKYQAMHQSNHQASPASPVEQEYASLEELEDLGEEAQNTPKIVPEGQKSDPFLEENSLNKAENQSDSGQTEEKYYFEPID